MCASSRLELDAALLESDDLAKTIARRLLEWTGERWLVAVSPAAGEQSIAERRDVERRDALEDAKGQPLVRAILARFPGAEIVDVRDSLAPSEEGDDDAAVPQDFDPESDEDPFEFLDNPETD